MMKLCKLLLLSVAVLSLLCGLCACGGNQPEDSSSAPENSAPVATTITEPADDKLTYTVTLVDESGNPIANTLIQMCNADSCRPAVTDANGVATWNAEEDDYEVYFPNEVAPEGYTYAGDTTKFHFEDDSTEMTITLKAALVDEK